MFENESKYNWNERDSGFGRRSIDRDNRPRGRFPGKGIHRILRAEPQRPTEEPLRG